MKNRATEPLFKIEVPVPPMAMEPVADRLRELGPGGLQWEDDKIPCILTTYIYGEKTSNALIAKMEEYIESIKDLFPGQLFGAILKTPMDSEEWAHAWKKFFKPTKVSALLIVKPTWEFYRKGPKEIIIDIDPEMAFGTGTHETTRLCLQAIENVLKSNPILKGCRLLDIGTGTGILSIAAIKLGAGSALGLDNDPLAVETAVKNARLNGVAQRSDFSTESLEKIRECFNLILANINSDTLCSLAPLIARNQAEGGTLVLGGIVNERAKEVMECFKRQGYHRFFREVMNEWTLLRAIYR